MFLVGPANWGQTALICRFPRLWFDSMTLPDRLVFLLSCDECMDLNSTKLISHNTSLPSPRLSLSVVFPVISVFLEDVECNSGEDFILRVIDKVCLRLVLAGQYTSSNQVLAVYVLDGRCLNLMNLSHLTTLR
jgi:hypothetical protein